MPWRLDSAVTKYNTAKPGVFDSSVKFDLWDNCTEFKVGHKTKTNDVSLAFKMKKPFELEVGHDIKTKTTNLKSKVEFFNDKVDLKLSQVVPGNKWSVIPSPKVEVEFEPSKKFETGVWWDFSTRTGGSGVKSHFAKKHEIEASAKINSSLKATELKASYEFMPRLKWCDEMEATFSTVSGLELQWETKPSKTFKTDVKANLKSKKLTAELEYKTASKKPMIKTVLLLGAPVNAPKQYTASATVQCEYKF